MHSLSSVRFAPLTLYIFFFFNDTATTEIYTLSLHDALPICGEARDVVDDVRRLGGFGIAAHPDSPKAELRWRDWTLPFDGVELLNPDTSWRTWAQEAAGGAGRHTGDAPGGGAGRGLPGFFSFPPA